jgi:RND family efflux transporter MFP subunit
MMNRFVLAVVGLLAAGHAGADERVELTTRVSGVVTEVLVKSGQRVDKGRVLLRLDSAILQARLDEAVAEQARAEADAADAARELARARELYERTVSSTTELDAAVLRDTRARATLAAAQARQAVAKKNLADAELKAPFAGVVQAVPGQPGTVVSADCQPKTLVILGSGRP